jgi:hypothetical protein
MLPRRRRERQPAGVGAVVAGADVRRVGRADRVVAVMALTREHKMLLTCEECGRNVLTCPCYSSQFDAAFDLSESRDRDFEYACDNFNPIVTNDTMRQWIDLVHSEQWTTPPDNCIPETARRILDMGRTQQVKPDAQPVDERAAGVARAVRALTSHEPRLGCHAWRP